MTEPRTTLVGDVPVAFLQPDAGAGRPPIALWLPHLTGTKEDCIPVLRRLAAAGLLAISIDPWQHGERAHETADELGARVFAGFRDHMWPILGRTTFDARAVIDWAVDQSAAPHVVAGGVSMGGDIAVALAGIDHRVRRVAAIVATPDWSRPGMHALLDPERLVDQGPAGSQARAFYDRLDPITHLDDYAHGPAIAFENGAADTHVPPDGAVRFRDALRAADPAAADRVRVTSHPGVGHIDGAQSAALLDRAIGWLCDRTAAANVPP